jgi:hypothetical protein
VFIQARIEDYNGKEEKKVEALKAKSFLKGVFPGFVATIS